VRIFAAATWDDRMGENPCQAGRQPIGLRPTRQTRTVELGVVGDQLNWPARGDGRAFAPNQKKSVDAGLLFGPFRRISRRSSPAAPNAAVGHNPSRHSFFRRAPGPAADRHPCDLFCWRRVPLSMLFHQPGDFGLFEKKESCVVAFPPVWPQVSGAF